MCERFPSLTKTWHSEPYDAISPTRPELSAKGKKIVVTGGGGAIGLAAALAFARAGATHIAVVGRRENPLREAKEKIESVVSGLSVKVVQGDIGDAKSINDAFEAIGEEFSEIDVLVASAGYLPNFGTVLDAEPDEWFRGFELNARGAFNLLRAFVKYKAEDAVVIDVSSCVVHMKALPGGSAYVASKLAATKVYEIFGAENPTVGVVSIHPGVIYSELNITSGVVATDDPNLPGHFILWAASNEAKPFRGKYLWCNWDVPELLQRRKELSQPDKLIITMDGWPFPYEAPTGLVVGG